MSLLVLRNPQELFAWRRDLTALVRVGFVPTMGALHQGHRHLLDRARKDSDLVVLSIFVNPTQFNDKKDLEKYPQTWESDLALAEQAGVDVVWAPTYEMMYPDNYRFKVSENELSLRLCGKDRPGHFDGVLTVVLKLLNVVNPTKAYFGEKDFQQLTLVKDMVKALFLPVEIVAVPTVREKDGLAMSSRNQRLQSNERELAPIIYKTLLTSKSAGEAIDILQAKGLSVDYVEEFAGRKFAAVRLGEVRLIDNVEI